MRVSRRVVVVALGALACGVACKDRSAGRAPRPGSSVAASGSAAGQGSAKGLTAADADKDVVELATKAAACRWDKDGVSQDCAAALEWRDATSGFEGGHADATLVDLVEDKDEKVRWLGATKLASSGKAYRTTKALADRVVAAGERETSPRLAEALGLALARVDVEKTQTFDRVRAMIVRHALPSFRAALVSSALRYNPTSAGTYEVTREMVHDADAGVRLAAVNAFWMGGSRRPEDTCRVWLDATASEDDDVAAQATENLTHFGQCEPSYGALLDGEDRRRKAAKTSRPKFCSALGYLCDDVRATSDQKQRATVILRAIAELDLLEPTVRGAALAATLRCDPSGGKAYVRKFTGEEQQTQVRAIATALLAPQKR